MKNFGIVITDGVGFRNFVLSGFLDHASKNCKTVKLFSCLPISIYENVPMNCEIIELKVFKEKAPTWFFRKLKEITHLRINSNQNFGIRDNLSKNYTTSKSARGSITRLIFGWSSIIKSERLILFYNYLQQQSFKSDKITKEYKTLIEKASLSCIFFTHQRPSYIAPMIYAANKANIKTACFIFSWDNLASKGRMAGNFDRYLVWSDLMKTELCQFYKSIKSDQIAVVGTPQFEPYVLDRFGYTRSKLCEQFNLNPDLPIIFFTCNDSSSKNDPLYLEVLAQSILDNELVKKVNLVVRTSPAEDPDRFKSLAESFDFIRWNYPDWKVTRANHQEGWSQRVPSHEDINDLKSLLAHCDININVLSTISLDSFLFDKPVINPVFGNANNDLFDDQKFLNYQHLEKLVDSNASHIVKDKNEYINKVNELLERRDDKAAERTQFLNLQIGKPLEGTSERIALELSKIN